MMNNIENGIIVVDHISLVVTTNKSLQEHLEILNINMCELKDMIDIKEKIDNRNETIDNLLK